MPIQIDFFQTDLFNLTDLTLWGTGYVFMAVAMTLVYGLSRLLKNAGIVDVFWGFGLLMMSLFYWVQGDMTGLAEGWGEKQLGMMAIYALSSIRLGTYLLQRFLKEFPVEDARYTSYREAWGKNQEMMVFLVFHFQGLLLVTLTLPMVLVLLDRGQFLSVFNLVAIALGLVAIVGEYVADSQLARFKHDEANNGKTCQIGLWQYSRHPNYFFQWLLWVAIALYAVASPAGLFAWIAPALMLYFLLFVTGIKATEERALVSRGDYAEYQKRTSAFIPWFPKRVS
jgi:steroid 5-alpha reductase family enzyme